MCYKTIHGYGMLQQCLPFTVLKQQGFALTLRVVQVATVLTVYGIETSAYRLQPYSNQQLQQCLPFTVLKLEWKFFILRVWTIVATVLTVYGIETNQGTHPHFHNYVATVLTVYGIETSSMLRLSPMILFACCNSTYRYDICRRL